MTVYSKCDPQISNVETNNLFKRLMLILNLYGLNSDKKFKRVKRLDDSPFINIHGMMKSEINQFRAVIILSNPFNPYAYQNGKLSRQVKRTKVVIL